jgi:hypothetical protein
MHRRWTLLVVLAAMFTFSTGYYSGCDNKGRTTDLLLGYGGSLRRNPVGEDLEYSADFPAVPNPFTSNIDTEWQIYLRQDVALDPLYRYTTNDLRFQVYYDSRAATGTTGVEFGSVPQLLFDERIPITGDGLHTINFFQYLQGKNFFQNSLSQTADDFRVRVGAEGTLQLGTKRQLRGARNAFLRGREPYPSGAGSFDVFALTTTTSRGTGQTKEIMDVARLAVPVFAVGAYDD